MIFFKFLPTPVIYNLTNFKRCVHVNIVLHAQGAVLSKIQ